MHEICSSLKLQAVRQCLAVGTLDVAEELIEEQKLHGIGRQSNDPNRLEYLLSRLEVRFAQVQQLQENSKYFYDSLNAELQELFKNDGPGPQDFELHVRKIAAQGEGLLLAALEPGISPAEKSNRSSAAFQHVCHSKSKEFAWIGLLSVSHFTGFSGKNNYMCCSG